MSDKSDTRRNRISGVFQRIEETINRGKNDAHDVGHLVRTMAHEKKLQIPYVDLQIQFIGANGLPKMDVVGTADPYFVANIDEQISYVSTVIPNNLAPVFNEMWCVKNVPAHGTLLVDVFDKDVGQPRDDYIGGFKTSVTPGTKEVEIQGPFFQRHRGTFWLKIDSTPSTARNPQKQSYVFDGPIRYSRHFSPTVGLLAKCDADQARLYSTWKMYLRGVPLYLGESSQPWNRDYKAAQSIFEGPSSVAVRAGIQAGHRMLYARSTRNDFGVITTAADVLKIFQGLVPQASPSDRQVSPPRLSAHRVRPAVYTYIISSEDDSFRFSETGAAFFVDFASKHALHSNCGQTVRYAGEFHPRPEGGWQNFNDDIRDEDVKWELVIDNNSGTYAPDPMGLADLQTLLEYNFPDFKIITLDFKDERLAESVTACRKYAVERRGVSVDELQPHAGNGETTLHRAATVRAATRSSEDVTPEDELE